MSVGPTVNELEAGRPDFPMAEGRAVAGWYKTTAEGISHSVVVLVMGYECWLESVEGGECLLVEVSVLQEVRQELARYDRENEGWPPAPPGVEPRIDPTRGVFPPLLWALVVVAVFREQQHSAVWAEVGAMDARAFFAEGQWWRPFSALWLHADAGHLVSNLVSGYFVLRGWFALSALGRGWLALLGSSVLANVLVAAAHWPEDHRSLGASTLVFAGLGLLTGRALRFPRGVRRWRPLFVPFAAGLTMLGLFGAGGENVDVLAHGAGFGVGALVGWAVTKLAGRSGGLG